MPCRPPTKSVQVTGIPDHLPRPLVEDCRMQIVQAIEELMSMTGLDEISIQIGSGAASGHTPPLAGDVAGLGASSGLPLTPRPPSGPGDELTVEERADQYTARKPLYDFDFLVVPDEVEDALLSAVDLIKVEDLVFDRWNLRSIEPFPRSALNFYGPPGTGKTLAAHAAAGYLGKKILLASYAQVESKYVGDASKNIEAVFYAAERDRSVLFIDEADSLLSKRLTDVNQGAEQAINSMRSQLLICLERYKGIVIFSTNLVENYDPAFQTRMRFIHFPLPDQPARRKIWERHLPRQLPLGPDVDVERLSAVDDLCGRDIKNIVIDAALRAARTGVARIDLKDLLSAADRTKKARVAGRRRSKES